MRILYLHETDVRMISDLVEQGFARICTVGTFSCLKQSQMQNLRSQIHRYAEDFVYASNLADKQILRSNVV